MRGTICLTIGHLVIDIKRYYTKSERRTIMKRWKLINTKFSNYEITIIPDEQPESTTISQIARSGCIHCYCRIFSSADGVRNDTVGV